MTSANSTLIIRFVSRDDFGPGGGSCPHCGATGRYVTRFLCADGVERGAMDGCIKAFRVAPFAAELRKCEDLLKRYPGWRKIETQRDNILRSLRVMYPGAFRDS